ncbi:MAG: hypothetical protein ACE364_06935 [Chlorobiota bacterium]
MNNVNRKWKEIEWIFRPDGSLRDIYIQDTTIDDWNNLLDLLNDMYSVVFYSENSPNGIQKIDKKWVIENFKNNSGLRNYLKISIENININCHFFLVDEIEFDLDPNEINSIDDYYLLESFMKEISKLLEKQITLTEEDEPEFPLLKIDSVNDVNLVMSFDEVIRLRNNSESLFSSILKYKTMLEIKLMPNKFRDKLLKNAAKPHRPTKKGDNIW